MMAILSSFLLLAACFSIVTPGPVPQRQLFTSYANTTSTTASIIETARPSSVALESSLGSSTSTESLIPLSSTVVLSLSTSPHPSLRTPESLSLIGHLINADTAVIIEPVQPTVIEHTIPAITYLNPNGEPLVTQDLEILSSTSFITLSTQTSKYEHTSSTTSVSSNTYEKQSATSSDESKTQTSLGVDFTPTPSSSPAVAESGLFSSSSFKLPVFTYSPEEDETSTPMTSLTVSATTKTSNSSTAFATTSVLTSSTITSSSAFPNSSAASTIGTSLTLRSSGLPGFSFNATGSRGADIPQSSTHVSVIHSSSITQSTLKSSSLPVFESSGVLTPPVVTDRYPTSIPPGVADSTIKTDVIVTTTEYTTVFPPPSGSVPPSSVPTISSVAHTLSSVSATSSLIQGTTSSLSLTSATGFTLTTTTPSQNVILSSSTVAALPSTPLEPPPVVIVTQYTTTTPPATPFPSNTSKTSSTPALPGSTPASSTSSSVYAIPSSSAVELPISTPTPSLSISEPAPSSNVSSASTKPSSTGHAPPPVTTSEVAPITTETPPAPSSASEISSTEGPLIITPIPPSQIFTITVTEKDKETVTETATVTVTA